MHTGLSGPTLYTPQPAYDNRNIETAVAAWWELDAWCDVSLQKYEIRCKTLFNSHNSAAVVSISPWRGNWRNMDSARARLANWRMCWVLPEVRFNFSLTVLHFVWRADQDPGCDVTKRIEERPSSDRVLRFVWARPQKRVRKQWKMSNATFQRIQFIRTWKKRRRSKPTDLWSLAL